jgi:hypothetical protein
VTELSWTPRLVEALFEEAAASARALPELRVGGFFNTWPGIKRSSVEVASMTPGLPRRSIPSPTAITRMDEVMLWLRWLDREDQKLVWDRANRRPWKLIAHDRSIDRTTAWRRWTIAIATIAARLNGERNNVATTDNATTSA